MIFLGVLKSVWGFIKAVGLVILMIIFLAVLAVYVVLSWTKTFAIMHFGSHAARERRQAVLDARAEEERYDDYYRKDLRRYL